MIAAMTSTSWQDRVGTAGNAPLRWIAGWGRIVFFGASLLVLALSPATYSPETRRALLHHIYVDTAPVLAWFTTLAAFLTLVITRIVVVTALSYGLSQYALEMVVRVLVLELIPLTAALFAALRCTIPMATELAGLRAQRRWDDWVREGLDPLRREVLPRVAAGEFCALMLAAVSCVASLTVAYLSVY